MSIFKALKLKVKGVPLKVVREAGERFVFGRGAFFGRGERIQIGRILFMGTHIHVADPCIIHDDAAGSAVTKDVPPRTIWGGMPARQIRPRFLNDADRALHLEAPAIRYNGLPGVRT